MNLIFITCNICNTKVKKLGNHLYHSHPDITYKIYYDKYLKQPDDGICKICGKPTKFDNKRRHYLACCSETCNKKYTYQQTKKALIEKYGVDNPFKSQELMADSYKNKDYNKRTVKTRQTKLEKYGDPGFCNAEKRKQTNIKKYGAESFTQTSDFCKKRKNTMINKYGYEQVVYNRELFLKIKKKYVYNNLQFDSSWEIAYYIWLKDHNIEFEYQPDISFEYEYNGKIHKYFPDFKIGNEIIEIKSDYLYNKMLKENTIENAKFNCIKSNNIKILLKSDIKKYLKYITKVYGLNYLAQFKK